MNDYMDTAFGTPPYLDNTAEEIDKKRDKLVDEIWQDMQDWDLLEDAVIDYIPDFTKDYEMQLRIRDVILPRIKELYNKKK